MKQIPQYSLVIFPNPEQSELVKSYKQLLKNKIGWFGSANAAAHITIIQFNTDLELSLYIEAIWKFCETVTAKEVRLNSLGKFEKSGAFYISPDSNSKLYLDSLIINLHNHLGFKIEAKDINAHMSIARKLFGDKLKTAEELFENIDIDLKFKCNAFYLRRFNDQTKQYSDIVEKIAFGI